MTKIDINDMMQATAYETGAFGELNFLFETVIGEEHKVTFARGNLQLIQAVLNWLGRSRSEDQMAFLRGAALGIEIIESETQNKCRQDAEADMTRETDDVESEVDEEGEE